MYSHATATEAENPGLYRERLEAERHAQRQHVRLEIVRLIVGALNGAFATSAEVAAAAKTIEEFVIGDEAKPAADKPAGLDGIGEDVRRRRDLLAEAKAIEDGLAAAGVSLTDHSGGGTSWRQGVAVSGYVSRDYGQPTPVMWFSASCPRGAA